MPALRISFLALSCALLAPFAGCSKPEPPVTPAAAEFRAVPIAAPATQPTQACAMVTAEQMAAILGGAVVAKANGQDKCIFTAVAGPSPYAELKIERGDGEIAMRAMGMMNRAEPGITDPLAGLGDQAAQVGPAFMIRSGQDLVTIVFSGVDDTAKKAHAVFDIVQPKL